MKIRVEDTPELRVRYVLWNEEHKELRISFESKNWELDSYGGGSDDELSYYFTRSSYGLASPEALPIAATVTLITNRFHSDKSAWLQYEMRSKQDLHIIFHEWLNADESSEDVLYESESSKQLLRGDLKG